MYRRLFGGYVWNKPHNSRSRLSKTKRGLSKTKRGLSKTKRGLSKNKSRRKVKNKDL